MVLSLGIDEGKQLDKSSILSNQGDAPQDACRDIASAQTTPFRWRSRQPGYPKGTNCVVEASLARREEPCTVRN